jgi:hypothetical protein
MKISGEDSAEIECLANRFSNVYNIVEYGSPNPPPALIK